MSQENVEVVRRVVEAFNRQDWTPWNSLYHPDAEWFDTPEVPGSGVHRGREVFVSSSKSCKRLQQRAGTRG
jgi:ketosteroid isomerase-like protein